MKRQNQQERGQPGGGQNQLLKRYGYALLGAGFEEEGKKKKEIKGNATTERKEGILKKGPIKTSQRSEAEGL